MKINAAIASAILAFTSTASAHLVLANPKGFPGNQDPLNESGADYPCGLTGGWNAAGINNNWKADSEQHIAFEGTATHSGGSCQFAFSLDEKPTKDSKWYVIHSVVGGCPFPDGKTGNADQILGIPASATWKNPNKYAIKIPKDMPNGRRTFAWVWFNKTGNREMYMKCAPVNIQGGADKADKKITGLPQIFKANIGNGCHTLADHNVNYPHPGNSKEIKGKVDGNGFTGNCGGDGAAPKGDGPKTGGGGGQPAPAPAPEAPKQGGGGGGGSCSAPGAMSCRGEKKFVTCPMPGQPEIIMDMAAGTCCRGNAIAAC